MNAVIRPMVKGALKVWKDDYVIEKISVWFEMKINFFLLNTDIKTKFKNNLVINESRVFQSLKIIKKQSFS